MSVRSESNQLIFVSSRIESLRPVRLELQTHYSNNPGFDLWIYERKTASILGNPAVYIDAVSRSSLFVLIWEGSESQPVIDELIEALRSQIHCLIFIKEGVDRTILDKNLGKFPKCRAKWTEWSSDNDLFEKVVAAIDDTVSLALRHINLIVSEIDHRSTIVTLQEITEDSLQTSQTSDLPLTYSQVLAEATELYNNGNDAAAKEILGNYVNSHRGAVQSLTLEGSLCLDDGDYINAERLLSMAVAKDPDYVPAHWSMGMLYHLQNKPKEAVENFIKVRELGVSNHFINVALGLSWMKIGSHEEALGAFCDALRQETRDQTALAGRAFCLYSLGRKKEARSAINELLSIYPDNMPGLTILGEILTHEGKPSDAEVTFKRVLELDKESEVGWLGLASSLGKLGKEKDSLDIFRKWLRPIKDFGLLYSQYGVAASHCGLHEESIEAHRKAVQLVPENFMTHYNLGCAMCLAGYFDDALASLEKAIRLNGEALEIALNDADLLAIRHLLATFSISP